MYKKQITEKEIEILKADRNNRQEAIKALQRGTQIYNNPLEWIESLKESNCYNGQTIEAARAGKYAGDISIVIYNNHEYLIEYVN